MNGGKWIKCVIQLEYSCILSVEITSDFIATYVLQPSHCIKPLMNARVINGIEWDLLIFQTFQRFLGYN